jgi:peptide chain release factor subunit 1
MVTRDEIRELAYFQADESKGECALSCYFQPDPPQDRSHRREAIVAKDVVKQALKGAAAQGKNGSLHADVDRVLELAANLRGNSRGKAVFACSAKNFWREYELPPRLGGTHIYLEPRFHLKPLAALLGAQPALCVAMVDRQRARVFDLRLDDLRERGAIVHMLSRSGSNYGYNGYEAGHAERRVAEEALQHFKAVAERLRVNFEKGIFERLIVGCQDANWSEFEPHLHPYVRQRLIGRFSADVASVSNEEIREHAGAILKQWIAERATTKVSEALDLAKSNSRGVTALRRVLQSLETGGVQTIFLSEGYSARASECSHCGHLDAHLVSVCAACGNPTRELADVCDAIIPFAIRRDIELFYLKENDGLDRAGNIAALLRFRSDQRTGQMAAAS